MKIRLSPCFLLIALIWPWGLAQAEKADRDKPMVLEADAMRGDDLKQIHVLTGNAIVTKGTLVLRGARIEVRQDPDGYQYGNVTPESGKLAFYRQKREGVDEYIEGEAQQIQYDGKTDVVKLIGKADLRRYNGNTLNDDISGSLIVYENTTDTFSVDGSAVGNQAGAKPGRVRAMLTPKANASTPSKPVSAPPSLKLQPSSTVTEEPK